MKKLYSKYYRDFYAQTGGFIPFFPFNQCMYPGDFFQIKRNEIIVLGNIYMNQLISAENCFISEARKLNENSWNLSSGVSKPYSGRGSGENLINGQYEFSRQLIKLKDKGSYLFKANDPEVVSIANWNTIKDELIIKLTQTYFSFREVYVVTDCATAKLWSIAVAGGHKAELEIASDQEDFGMLDLFGHESSKTIQSKDLELYHQEKGRIPHFFKAKKLGVNSDQLSTFISDFANKRESIYSWANNFYNYNFDHPSKQYTPPISMNAEAGLLDMLSAGELNPNTALKYFKWEDTDLLDLKRLFSKNG